ncbi:unnamed protein product, partial [Porites lobata]
LVFLRNQAAHCSQCLSLQSQRFREQILTWKLLRVRELQLHMQEQQKTLCEGVQNCLALFQTSLSEVSK